MPIANTGQNGIEVSASTIGHQYPVPETFYLTDLVTGEVTPLVSVGGGSYINAVSRNSVIAAPNEVIETTPRRVQIGNTAIGQVTSETVDSSSADFGAIPQFARSARLTITGSSIQYAIDGQSAATAPYSTEANSVTSFNLTCRDEVESFSCRLVAAGTPGTVAISYYNVEFEDISYVVSSLDSGTTGTTTSREAIGDPQAFLIPALDSTSASVLPAIPANARAAAIFLAGIDDLTSVDTNRSVRWATAATATLLPSATVANPSGGGTAITLGFNTAVQGEVIFINTLDELQKFKICTETNGQQMVGVIQYYTQPETTVSIDVNSSAATGTSTTPIAEIAQSTHKGAIANAGVIKTGSGSLFSVFASNSSGSALYLHLFDSATAPAANDSSSVIPGIPIYQASAGNPGYTILDNTFWGPTGLSFNNGLAWGVSTDPDQFIAPTGTPARVGARYS